MIETGLRTFLLADSSISAQVATRIYPLILPQSPTLPSITFQRISGVRVRSMDGPSGLAIPRIQIDVYHDTYIGAKQLAELVRLRLDGYTGGAGGENIQGAFLEDDDDLYESGDELVKAYRVRMDFRIGHDE